MFRYNQNTGEVPKTYDRIVICRTAGDMDGLTGQIQGLLSDDGYVAIVVLDEEYTYPTNGPCRAIVMPVVCLDIAV
jgi:hypothetical protein